MNIAVYTIAKNEEANAAAFMQNCKAADLILVGDGGSSDRTNEIIKQAGGKIIPLTVSPWRFDMARNAVLSLVPRDIDFCFAMDLDERFQQPNWREILEKQFNKDKHTRLKFRYIHSFNSDGTASTVGFKDFAHCRHSYHWQHAVHETLYYRGAGTEDILFCPELVVEHRQDVKKPRTSYRSLLELECESRTATPRHVFWLLREYVNEKIWPKCIDTADRFLRYEETWNVERMHALRYKAKAYSHLNQPTAAITAHYQSLQEAPAEREGWLDLAWFYSGRKQHAQAYGAVCQALTITTRPEHYLTADEAWGHVIHKLAALCANELGAVDRAREHLRLALKIAPTNQHLQQIAAKLETAGK